MLDPALMHDLANLRDGIAEDLAQTLKKLSRAAQACHRRPRGPEDPVTAAEAQRNKLKQRVLALEKALVEYARLRHLSETLVTSAIKGRFSWEEANHYFAGRVRRFARELHEQSPAD